MALAVVLAAAVLAACAGADPGLGAQEQPTDGSGVGAGDPDPGGGLQLREAPQPAPPVDPLPVETTLWDAGTIELADGTPIGEKGLTAAPTSGGPYPVAVLLHGSHPICRDDPAPYGSWPCPEGTEIAHHEGLGELASAVAARGFVVIAPGTNVQHTFGAGEPQPASRTAEIVERALAALGAGERGIDAALVDPDRLVVIGHSVGAQEATMLAAGVTSFARPVAGVVLLKPALWAEDALPLADVPAAVVIGECDGDTGVSGAIYVSDALLQPRTAPAALVSVAHATHNAVNTGLGPDPFPVESPGCAEDRTMDPEVQLELLGAIVPELSLAVLGDGGGGWAGIVFDEPTPPEGITLGVVPGGAAVAPLPGPNEAVVDTLNLDAVTVTFCPFGYYTPFVEPDRVPCHRPELPMMIGQPRTLSLAWDQPAATLTTELAAAPGDLLRLRVFADVADGRLGDGPVRLALATDAGGSVEVELDVPASSFQTLDEFDIWSTFAPWQTFTFEVGEVVSSVTLTMLAPEAGAVQVVSLGVD